MCGVVITKTKRVKIPKELQWVVERCQYPGQPHCGRVAKYYLKVRNICRARGLDIKQGMFLCEVHKEPRISVKNDHYRDEIITWIDWFIDSDRNIIRRLTKAEKKGTHKIGETIKIT